MMLKRIMNSKRLVILILLALGVIGGYMVWSSWAIPRSIYDPVTGGRIVPNVILVIVKPGTEEAYVNGLAVKVQGKVIGSIPQLSTFVIEIPYTGDSSGVHNAIGVFQKDPSIISASPDTVLHIK